MYQFLTFSKELTRKEIFEQLKVIAPAVGCLVPENLNLDRNICLTREDAETYLNDAEEFNAVKYLKYAEIPEEFKTERYKAAVERFLETKAHYEAAENAPLGNDGRTSAKVGCKNCGSSIAVQYLDGGKCPVCGYDLRNAARQNSIQSARKRFELAQKELEEASQYYMTRLKKCGEWNWLVRVECTGDSKSIADSLMNDISE